MKWLLNLWQDFTFWWTWQPDTWCLACGRRYDSHKREMGCPHRRLPIHTCDVCGKPAPDGGAWVTTLAEERRFFCVACFDERP